MRFPSLILLVCLAVFLSGCGGDEPAETPSPATGGPAPADPGGGAEPVPEAPPSAATEHEAGADAWRSAEAGITVRFVSPTAVSIDAGEFRARLTVRGEDSEDGWTVLDAEVRELVFETADHLPEYVREERALAGRSLVGSDFAVRYRAAEDDPAARLIRWQVPGAGTLTEPLKFTSVR